MYLFCTYKFCVKDGSGIPQFFIGDIAYSLTPNFSLVETPKSYKFPLNSCSRSMASNNALKLPAPKDCAPLR